MKLAGKVCIVTGASRGIGKAVAVGCAREGADVVIAARTDSPRQDGLAGTIHETAEMVRNLGRRAMALRTDVRKEEEVEAMVKRTLDELGRVDVLVHNAALAYWGRVVDTPVKVWNAVVGVNLLGAFLCAKAVLPQMIRQGSGSIINFSSPGADIGGDIRGGMAYSASKAGVERFSNGLAEEVRQHGIAVNCLKPARMVDSEGARFWNPGADYSTWASPDMMVRATIFLATQTSQGVTGGIFTDEELVVRYGL